MKDNTPEFGYNILNSDLSVDNELNTTKSLLNVLWNLLKEACLQFHFLNV